MSRTFYPQIFQSMCLGLAMDNEAGGGWIKEDFPCR